MDQDLGAGKEILSYCGKCKLTLAHTIVSMKDKNKIGKCECNTCKAQHLYRDPASVGKKKRSTSSTSRSPTKTWQQAIADATGATKPYSMQGQFDAGDILDHPVFGKGAVERVVDGKKVEAIFESGVKTLVCSN